MEQDKKEQKKIPIKKDANVGANVRERMQILIKEDKLDDKTWNFVTNKPGLNIWRVKNFSLLVVPESQYGTFYAGDSYIILNTMSKEGKGLMYDIYIWIGSGSTADEYGVAAYKMEELDHVILKNAAVQHRELQSNESEKFQQLFLKMSILKGGFDSGFRKVQERVFEPKLLHISGMKKNVKVTEISYRKDNLSSDDVFILDLGHQIFQINGKNCNKDEKYKGAQIVEEIKSDREICQLEVIDEYDVSQTNTVLDDLLTKTKSNFSKPETLDKKYSLLKLSNNDGKVDICPIKDGKCTKEDFNSNDIIIYDTNTTIFVWIGKLTPQDMKAVAMGNAQYYADQFSKKSAPIMSVKEESEPDEFLAELE